MLVVQAQETLGRLRSPRLALSPRILLVAAQEDMTGRQRRIRRMTVALFVPVGVWCKCVVLGVGITGMQRGLVGGWAS